MRPDISEEEAIRRIVQEGTCADFVDVASVVQERFGLRIGVAKVEEVVHAMKQEASIPPTTRLKHADIHLTGERLHEGGPGSPAKPAPERSPADSTPSRNEVLKFVESMGGFEAARTAISELEHSLKNLMK